MEKRLPTIDEKMVNLFSEFEWWNGKNLLQKINLLRTPFVCEALIKNKTSAQATVDSKKALKNISVLDVGCGGGIFSESLAKFGCSVVGIDPGTKAIEVAKMHAALNPSLINLSYSVELVEDHEQLNSNKYHAVILFDVLEHSINPQSLLKSCVACLAPKGSIFITTINRTWMAWIIGIFLLEKVTKTIVNGTHDYEKFITPTEVTNILNELNCDVKMVRGISYNFIEKSMEWSNSTSFLYALHAVKNF